MVECVIESRMVGIGGERGELLVDSREVEYREMHIWLKIVANLVLAMSQTP